MMDGQMSRNTGEVERGGGRAEMDAEKKEAASGGGEEGAAHLHLGSPAGVWKFCSTSRNEGRIKKQKEG